MRTVLTIALLALVVTAGCTGSADTARDSLTETTTETTPETTDATETTTDETRTSRTPTTSDEPQKGDQFLSASELNESQAMQWNASERAAFGNLSAERQQVVTKAIECGCSVELDGEFSFNDKERIKVVSYQGQYYYLRVAIV